MQWFALVRNRWARDFAPEPFPPPLASLFSHGYKSYRWVLHKEDAVSLSLEVRKFINSEHTGEYVDVTLPSELPVERDEVRTVHRDTVAAENAKRRAKECANIKANAIRNMQSIEDELSHTWTAAAKAKTECEQINAQKTAIMPEYNKKRELFTAAQGEYERKKAESDSLFGIFSEAESAKRRCEELYAAQNQSAAEKAAALQTAVSLVKSTEAELAALQKRMIEAHGENAEVETLAGKTSAEATEAAKNEAEKLNAVNELNAETIRLTGEKKVLEKQHNDAAKSEAKFKKDLLKAKADHESLTVQYNTAKSAAEAKQGSDKESAMLKVGGLKAKCDVAEANVKAQQGLFDAATAELSSIADRLTQCERQIAENAGALKTAQQSYDAAREHAKKAAELHAQDKARLASKSASATALSTQLEQAQARAADAKDSEARLRSASVAADAESLRLKTALDTAAADAAVKKTASDSAKVVTDGHEHVSLDKKSDFDEINLTVQGINGRLSAATDEHNALKKKIEKLESNLLEAKSNMNRAIQDCELAEAEAARLRDSVHVIQTKYETAKFHYMESGKGEPLILVHTAGQSLYTFRRLFYKLALSYRVIAVDLAGHGYSDRPSIFEYSIEDHGESLSRFMDALGIESAHLLGFSMGAAYVLELAHEHPDRVGKLILVSPGGITSEMPMLVRMMESPLLGGIASRLYSLKSVEKMLGECVFDHTVITEHDIKEYYRPASDPDGRFAIRRTISNFDENRMSSMLREIEHDVLIVWGEDDKWHPSEASEFFSAALRNCSYVAIRNAGHLVHEEKPDRLYDLIHQFIPAGYDTAD